MVTVSMRKLIARVLFTVSLMVLAHVAEAQSGPPCLPKVQWPIAAVYGPVPAGVSTRSDTYAVWVCAFPSGYVTTVQLFNLANVAPFVLQYAAGTWTAAQAAADCATTCVAPTATESAYMATLLAANRPRALVLFNGTSPTRNVYVANPDGTLNLTPAVDVSIRVAQPCDETMRMPGTPYYSIAGDTSVQGTVLPPGTFAICVVSLPIGAN